MQRGVDSIQRRVDDISKRFPGAGWMDLPQELVDEILGYLLEDLHALKACSLTCKHLFGAARPLIHQRLACFDSRPEYPKPGRWLFSRHKKDPGAFERLIDAGRSGVLPYTRHLILKPKYHHSYPRFSPSDLQEYLPHLRSITKLHTLTLDSFHLPQFIPVFNEYFGTFANTLRHLDIRRAYGTEQQLLYFICQFPRLEDLTIVFSLWERTAHPVPTITHSPPLRGKLVLVRPASRGFTDGFAALPGGLNFRSVELFQSTDWRSQRGDSRAVLAACNHTAASISYLWHARGDESEFSPSFRAHIMV